MIVLEKFKEKDLCFARIKDMSSLWSFTLTGKNTTIVDSMAQETCNELGLRPVKSDETGEE